MKELAEYSHEGLALVRKGDFTIISCNSVFRGLTSSSNPTESTAPLLSDLLPPDRLLELKNEFASGKQRWAWEYNFKPAKGRPIPLRMIVEIPKDGSSEDILVVRLTDESENMKKDLLMKSVGSMLDVNKKRIEESKKNFKSMLDRLPQGFLTFDSHGMIGQDCSARVDSIFDEAVAGRLITEVLPISPSDSELIPLVFSGATPSVCLEALPKEFHVGGKILEASFTPIIEDDKVAAVMVALADVTDYRALREALDRNTRIAKTLYTILSAKREFIETLNLIDSLSDSIDNSLEIRRKVHTLKGEFSFLDCQELAQLCHRWESEWHSGEYTPESGKTFICEIQESVDAFLREHEDILKIHRGQGVSDITLEGERLLDLYHRIKSSPVHDIRKGEILESIEQLLSPKLEEALGWLQKSWVDALSAGSKPSSSIAWQTSLRVFPRPYRELFKTFIHIVRNAAAHGIEAPEERAALGKPPAGSFSISASLEDGTYRICFTDDGRGIDGNAILEAAQRKGIKPDRLIGDNKALQLIFEPEFSSQDETDEISGRGLGLHIVQHEVKALGGTIEVHSKIGKGTTFTVMFPKLPIPTTF
jgi:two-component system chemotaxis sensor kinase CheA